jgi:hypothetical protein
MNDENVGATAFDLPNSQHPDRRMPMYYGNQHVPHPTNSSAKIVHDLEVMRAVREGK